MTFFRVRFYCPNFLPLHFFASPKLPPKNRSSGRNAGKVVRSTATATPGAGCFLAETGPSPSARAWVFLWKQGGFVGPPIPRRLDRPLVASEAAPGPRRPPGH
jgi:hypothetical protein